MYYQLRKNGTAMHSNLSGNYIKIRKFCSLGIQHGNLSQKVFSESGHYVTMNETWIRLLSHIMKAHSTLEHSLYERM